MFLGVVPVYEVIRGPAVQEGYGPSFLAVALVFDRTGEEEGILC